MNAPPGWDELCANLPSSLRAEARHPELADAVVAAHAGPGRHYHTLAHVTQALGELQQLTELPELAEHLTDLRELAVGLIFHDAIYAAARDDNEEQSAELCLRLAPRFFPHLRLPLVARLIRLTSLHGRLPGRLILSEQERLFLDCDLSILAAEAQPYDAYAIGVRREFEAIFGPARYDAGRRLFLERLLEGPRLFLSAHFESREATARRNLERELEGLPR